MKKGIKWANVEFTESNARCAENGKRSSNSTENSPNNQPTKYTNTQKKPRRRNFYLFGYLLCVLVYICHYYSIIINKYMCLKAIFVLFMPSKWGKRDRGRLGELRCGAHAKGAKRKKAIICCFSMLI